MEAKHTIKDPLKLQWDGSGYKVNKPNIDSEILVSKEVADELLEALIESELQIRYLHSKFKQTGSGNKVLFQINNAIKKATE